MPPEDQENQETSMRDDFETAISSIENDDEGAITNETAADAERAAAAEDLNDDDGQEAAKAEAQKQVEAEAKAALENTGKPEDGEDAAGGEPERGTGDSEPGAESASKAPESWPPAARENWGSLPEPVRAQISKREHEIDKTLNEGAQHRKTGAAFQDIADRYAQVIAAEGATDAITGVEELVKTVATLRMGSAQQKAQKIANFIEHYGIDVPMLDDMLSGKAHAAPGVAADDPIAAMINERLKPVDNLLARMDEDSRERNFKNNQAAINEVATFKAQAEFYTDVQNDMADMVEMAAKRGVAMPLQEAYDKACALNPEVSKVLAKRTSDAKLIGNQEEIRKKQAAAASISGAQGGGETDGLSDMSLHDTLATLYDAQTG